MYRQNINSGPKFARKFIYLEGDKNMTNYYKSTLDLIGNTPLVEV